MGYSQLSSLKIAGLTFKIEERENHRNPTHVYVYATGLMPKKGGLYNISPGSKVTVHPSAF